MECIFSETKKKVYWKLQDGSKTWSRPHLKDDVYDPKTKKKSVGKVETWRKDCNVLKKEIHTSMLVKNKNHLDLCCGRGGDVHKFKHAGLKMLIGIDVSPTAVEEAVCRSEKLGLKSRFFLQDLRGVKDPINSVRKYQYSSISMMFALHYFLESKETLINFILYLNNLNLSEGCKFYGITPNWQKIKMGKNLSYYKIQLDRKVPGELNENNCFGLAYNFWLEGLVETTSGTGVDEYLVYFPVVEHIFEQHGWKCLHLRESSCADNLYLCFCFQKF